MSIESREPVIQVGPGPASQPWIIPGPGPVIPPFPTETEPGPVIPPGQDIPRVKIKSLFSNAFIIVGYDEVLYAVGAIPQQGETFRIIPINNYQVKLRIVGGQFVRIDYNGALVADANKNNATIFNIFFFFYMEFSLMVPQGKYVNVKQRDNMLVARSEYAGPRTRFKFRMVD